MGGGGEVSCCWFVAARRETTGDGCVVMDIVDCKGE